MPPKPVSAHTHPAYYPKTIRIKHLGYCALETLYLRATFKHHDKDTYHVALSIAVIASGRLFRWLVCVGAPVGAQQPMLGVVHLVQGLGGGRCGVATKLPRPAGAKASGSRQSTSTRQGACLRRRRRLRSERSIALPRLSTSDLPASRQSLWVGALAPLFPRIHQQVPRRLTPPLWAAPAREASLPCEVRLSDPFPVRRRCPLRGGVGFPTET